MKKGLLLASLIFVNSFANAQSNRYSQSPINLKAKKLPPLFLGHNPKQIYQALDSKKLIRGKYESSDEWENRNYIASSSALFGNTYSWSPLGIAIKPSFCDYNADTERFEAHFAGFYNLVYENLGTNPGEPYECLLFNHSVSKTNSQQYVAQNGFGFKALIRSDSYTTYGFGITNLEEFKFVPTSSSKTKYRISSKNFLPAPVAQKLEKNIAALFIGYVNWPYQGKRFVQDKATFDDPFMVSTSAYYACIRLKEVWFYDIKTGYIYGKSKPL